MSDARVTFVALIVLGLFNATDSKCAEQAGRTNVIVFFADDLGWGDVGCYGNKTLKTPNLDRLAAEGARLTNFYTSCPFCAPSRASLMTGRYHFRSGMTRNPTPDKNINDVGLPDSEVTLGEAFQAAGYKTICIGKWHLGHRPEFKPLRHGFDEYLGILYSNDMRPVELIEGDQAVEYPVIQATLSQRYADRAIRFMEANREQPFFIYLPFAMPHKPLAASEKFYKSTGHGLYADTMAELDASIGRVLEKLQELQLDKNTLVFFSSDNGPWYGGSSGGLRGMKGTPFEGGIRVPLIARWPGRIPAGHVSHEPAIIMDLFVTALTAAGVDVPKTNPLDGRDILPVLTSDAKSPHDALFGIRGADLQAVRSGKWKLHVGKSPQPRMLPPDDSWIDPRAPDGVTIIAPYEQARPSQHPGIVSGDQWDDYALFDLDADPAEQHNVAGQHPEVVKDLRKKFDAMKKEIAATVGE